MTRSRGGVVILAIVAIVVAIAALAITTDVRDLGDRARGFAWAMLPVATGLALANYAIRYLRWSYYLRLQDVDVPGRSSAMVFVAGLSLSITPGKVGELGKAYLLRELHDVPITRSTPVVIAERVTDLIAIVVLASIGAAIYGVAIEATAIAAAIVVAGLAIVAMPGLARPVIRAITRPGFARRFRDRLLEIQDGIAALCRPRRLAIATLLGCAGWVCECVAFAIVVDGFPGASIDLGLAMLVYAITTLAGAISFVPGGVGVTEGAMTVFLVQSGTGLDVATAATAAILFRFATLWFAVALGLAAMWWCRRTIAAASS